MRFGAFVMNPIARHLINWLYPLRCEGCDLAHSGGEGINQWMCDACVESLPRIKPPYCETCGESYDGHVSHSFQCGNCAETHLHFDFAVAAFEASGTVRELIHRFKYQRELHLRGLLAALLAEAFKEPRLANICPEEWLLVPVPLHRLRRWSREFNQSWEICKQLSRLAGIPVCNALSRIQPTRSQARLTRRQRLINLRGSFRLSRIPSARHRIAGANVLLLDDVLTTGSTASECAKILKREGGAEKVVVISVGRG